MAVTAVASGTETPVLGTITVTIATPGVFTYVAHGLAVGDTIQLTTTGALPTGLSAGTVYFVIAAGLATDTFEVSTTSGGSAVNTSGTQSGVHSVTEEDLLADISAAGTYTLHVDMINMAAGDSLELRAYQMVLTGGTRRVAYYAGFDGAQPADDTIKISVPISNELTDTGALRFTLKQVAGTPRAFAFKILKYA